jgi:hypothetical protein
VKNQASVDLVRKDHIVVVDLIQKELSYCLFHAEFLADLSLRAIFWIFVFQKIPYIFPRMFLRMLTLRVISCGFFNLRKFRRYSQGYTCEFWHPTFLRILPFQEIMYVTFDYIF